MGEINVNCRPPSWLERIWYRRIGMPPPLSTGSSSRVNGHLLRLAPHSWRRFHRLVADWLGYYWLPCPLCGAEFGGHEHGESIPDPARPPHGGIAICSRCTITRNRESSALLREVREEEG
jgi:hypothetical protein